MKTYRSTIIALTVLSCAMAVTTACSTDDDTSSLFRHNAPLSTTIDETAVTTAPATLDDVFLTVVRHEIPNAGQAHIDLAHTICDTFDSGASAADVVSTMIEAGGPLTNTQKGSLLGAGVNTYCPEYHPQLQAFFASVNGGQA